MDGEYLLNKIESIYLRHHVKYLRRTRYFYVALWALSLLGWFCAGQELPEWDSLDYKIKYAWGVAAGAVRIEVNINPIWRL